MRRFALIILLSILQGSFILAQTLSGDIETHITAYINALPGSNQDDYQLPQIGDLDTWEAMLEALFNDDLEEARSQAAVLNYQIIEYEDISVNPTANYYLVEELQPKVKYWGSFILNRTPKRGKLVIQIPHPRYDSNTGYQGIFCFKNLGAAGFFISGTHRCNSSQFSVCSGTTSACSSSAQSYRISDPAHNVNGVFQKSTEVFASNLPQSVFVQLHGFAKRETDPYLIMSNGTRDTPDPDYTKLISDELIRIDDVLTSKIAHIDKSWSRLIAFTNTQGRYLNGSPNPCATSATLSSGRFIHIEQEKSRLRQDYIKWFKMYEALSIAIPEDINGLPKDPLQNLDLKVYPNPGSGRFHVHFKGFCDLEIYDLKGKRIWELKEQAHDAIIDITQAPPGIYLLRVIGEQGVDSRKIIHQ